MPKLRTILDNLDEVPESIHDCYVEKDGKFILELDGINDHPGVVALKNALERQKVDRRKATDELATLKARLTNIPEDFDRDAYDQMLAELEELKNHPDRGKDDKEAREAVAARKLLEQKIANLEKKHADELANKDKSISEKDDTIAKLLIDDGLTKALVEAGVDPKLMKAAKALLRNDCKVVQDNGAYTAIVASDTGDLPIDKYVQDWVASDEGKAFIPPAKGGDSGNTGKPTRPQFTDKNPWSKEHFNMTEQGRIIKEDRTRAEKLAKAAGKTLPAPIA